jgi:hypothetical protein
VKVGGTRAAAPIIKVSTPRSVTKRVKHGARRAAGAVWGERSMIVPIIGAWALGHLEKDGTLNKVPRVLGMGPVASAAVLAFVASKYVIKTPLARGVALGLACVAANAHGRTGQLNGADVLGGYPGGAVAFEPAY